MRRSATFECAGLCQIGPREPRRAAPALAWNVKRRAPSLRLCPVSGFVRDGGALGSESKEHTMPRQTKSFIAALACAALTLAPLSPAMAGGGGGSYGGGHGGS